jgi:dihydrofolate synthase/folylpolyglutamate synthase
MNYNEVVAYIEERNKMGSVLGLQNIINLLGRLGNPEKKIPAFHIAGTNGKGSIMAYVETVLIRAGLKVGRYISPTIYEYRERWQINKEYISAEECSSIMTDVINETNKMDEENAGSPTSFEIETAAAFHYFAKNKCDVILIECGMGGRLDATNVFGSTPIDVIASISFDHMQFLGNTLESIANEKLGIVKDGDILVSYPQNEEVEKIIDDFARNTGRTETRTEIRKEARTEKTGKETEKETEKESVEEEKSVSLKKYYKADRSALKVISQDLKGSAFYYKGDNYSISLVGSVQIMNAITAIEAINAFNQIAKSYGLKKIDRETVIEGLKDTKWDGRFTVLGEQPLFIADGAHNEEAWIRLAADINKYFTNRKLIFIIGVLKDKEYDKMLNLLTKYMYHAITITSSSIRALDGKYLAELINERGVSAEFIGSEEEAVDKAESLAKEVGDDSVIIACGSLSFIGDIIRIKKEKDNE